MFSTRYVHKRAPWLMATATFVILIGFTNSNADTKDLMTSDKVQFSVKFKDEINPYRIFGVYLLPGEHIELECVFAHPKSRFTASASAGAIKTLSKDRWSWKAPRKKGLYPLTITDKHSRESMVLQIFVMVPFTSDHTQLNGYRIGRYRQKALKNNPVYKPPKGFIEITSVNRNENVSPHFTLGQFISKQPSGYPKYVALRERLLLKLEMILEAVKQRGYQVSTLHIMSGFRTPYYNRAIGNRTQYSRHLYGDAADIFIDHDQDNVMDDLNGDGRTTLADAQVLANLIMSKAKEAWYRPFVGGLGIYGPRSHRGPFVHVDVRGYMARWTNP